LSVENVWINRGVLPLLTTYGDVNFEIFSFLNMELMPPRINFTTELISYQESIPLNQCLGSSKIKKFRIKKNMAKQAWAKLKMGGRGNVDFFPQFSTLLLP
jgi:hypothetical protein